MASSAADDDDERWPTRARAPDLAPHETKR